MVKLVLVGGVYKPPKLENFGLGLSPEISTRELELQRERTSNSSATVNAPSSALTIDADGSATDR